MKGSLLASFTIILILLISLVIAEPDISISPSEFYETNDIDFQIDINNFGNDYEIKSIQTDISPLQAIEQVDYFGWYETMNNSLFIWDEGSIATNVYLAIFEFLATAPKIETNTSIETTITLADNNNNDYLFIFPILIVNDDTAPELSNFSPINNSFIKAGITDYVVSVSAIDLETGINNIMFQYTICNPEINTTPEFYSVELNKNNTEPFNTYSNTVDFSMYENEDEVCFSFTANNNGGETTTYKGKLTVDNIPPVVALISPKDKTLISVDSEFKFIADDNLADELICTVYIDDETYIENISVVSGTAKNIINADIEEGIHNWSVNCLDMADLKGNSDSWSYTLDKTPPVINLVSIKNNSIIADTTSIDFIVNDNYGFGSVMLIVDGIETKVDEIFSVNVSEWKEGLNEFVVRAIDSVGNEIENSYVVIVDRTTPEILLISPENDVSNDVHVSFKFESSDNFDSNLNCSLFIDDVNFDSINTNESDVFEEILNLGNYMWKIMCVDDAGNSGLSDERTISIVDLSGPDIVVVLPDLVFRGDMVKLSLTVTDISGVGYVEAVLRNIDDSTQTIPLENVEDMYVGTINTSNDWKLGNYFVDVTAIDTLNNSRRVNDNFNLTYKYDIELTLNPSNTTPNSEILISGTISKDNNSDIPENNLIITLFDNTTKNVKIINNTFVTTITAPNTTGNFNIKASVLSEENGQTYVAIADLIIIPVATNNLGSDGSGSNGGSGGSNNYGSNNYNSDYINLNDYANNCAVDWSCTMWTTCENGKQKRTCVDLNKCNDDSMKLESRSCTIVKKVKENGNDKFKQTIAGTNVTKQIPVNTQQPINQAKKNSKHSIGFGKAFGFLNLGNINFMNLLFVIIAMAVLLGLLSKYGWNSKKTAPQDILNRRSDISLDDYLDSRAKRKR